MKIKISVTATDTESGVAQISYSITPNTVDSTTPAERTLQSGEEKEIITTAECEYTVTFTATDKEGNTSAPVTAKATTRDEMTVAEVKEKVNESNIADYIGTKVIDYEKCIFNICSRSATIEMWCKAQNIYKAKYDTSASTIGCGIQNANGYGYTINGGSLAYY